MKDIKILKNLGFSDYFINLLLSLSGEDGGSGIFAEGIRAIDGKVVMGGTISTDVIINGVLHPNMVFKFFDVAGDMLLANDTTAIRLNGSVSLLGDAAFKGNGTLMWVDDGNQTINLGQAIFVDILNSTFNFGNYAFAEFRLTNKTVAAANYTMTPTDSGKIINFTNAGGCIVTISGGFFALPVGFTVTLIQQGAGVITFNLALGAVLRNRLGQFESAGQYAAMSIFSTSANTFILGGDTA